MPPAGGALHRDVIDRLGRTERLVMVIFADFRRAGISAPDPLWIGDAGFGSPKSTGLLKFDGVAERFGHLRQPSETQRRRAGVQQSLRLGK
jgi:hypothetical protein